MNKPKPASFWILAFFLEFAYLLTMIVLIRLLMIVCFLGNAGAMLVSTTVGQVRDHVLTSREILLNLLIQSLQKNAPMSDIGVNPQNPSFKKQIPGALLDEVLSQEAKALQVVTLDSKQVENLIQMVEHDVQSHTFKKYHFSEKEIKCGVSTVLLAQKFIALKTETSAIPVSDADARAYFEKNQERFGLEPFENFRTTIRKYLIKTQLDARLQEWFESLRTKYKVKNFVTEN